MEPALIQINWTTYPVLFCAPVQCSSFLPLELKVSVMLNQEQMFGACSAGYFLYGNNEKESTNLNYFLTSFITKLITSLVDPCPI